MLQYEDFQSYRKSATELSHMTTRLQIILRRAQRNIGDDSSTTRLAKVDIGKQSLHTLINLSQHNSDYMGNDDKGMVHLDFQAYPGLIKDMDEIKCLIDALNRDLSDGNLYRLERLQRLEDIHISAH